jgi:hypothetical protein
VSKIPSLSQSQRTSNVAGKSSSSELLVASNVKIVTGGPDSCTIVKSATGVVFVSSFPQLK